MDYDRTSWPGSEMKCSECGKVFNIPYTEYWVYKRQVYSKKAKRKNETLYGIHYFCSWSCMRSFDSKYAFTEKQIKEQLATKRKQNALKQWDKYYAENGVGKNTKSARHKK